MMNMRLRQGFGCFSDALAGKPASSALLSQNRHLMVNQEFDPGILRLDDCVDPAARVFADAMTADRLRGTW